MKIHRKISTKIVVGNVKTILADMIKKDEDQKDLYTVVGIATRTITGTSDYGDWIAFGGQFSAINLSDGVEIRSAKCFLPETATDMVLAALAPDDVTSAQFGFKIGIERDDESQVGYNYTVEPIMKPEENDPLELLLSKTGTQQLEDKSNEKSTAPKKAAPKKK